MALILFSPAKINLFLRVLGKRPDGYHELASLFQAVNLGDTLTLAFAEHDTLTCTDPSLACDRSNLVCKAIDLFRRKTNLSFSVSVHLEKKIPMQAGLGGGSSNAATTLWGLNALHHHPISEKDLQMWSSEIGSDIPFFFSLGTAYCTGRGEKVYNLPPPNLHTLDLYNPPFNLPTQAIYQALQQQDCSSEDPLSLLEGFYSGQHNYINDLEHPAFRLSPNLHQYKQRLQETHSNAWMTGSGGALIADNNSNKQILEKSHHIWSLHSEIKPLHRTPLGWY